MKIAVAVFFSVLSFAAISGEYDEIKAPSKINTICAKAISIALNDLEFTNKELPREQFYEEYAEVSCEKEGAEQLHIRFFNKILGQNGGVVNYFIDSDSFTIVRKVGER